MMLHRSAVEEKVSVIRLAQIIVQRQSSLLKDAEALTSPEAFEKWAPDMPYGEGQIVYHEPTDKLYRVVQTGGVTKSQAHQPPGGEGMLAVYRPIEVTATGTKDDPIRYTYGMDTREGKYYKHEGKLYLCKSDMLPCIWPPGTVGLWQWEEVTT